MTDLEEKAQIFEARKILQTKGWSEYILTQLAFQREAILTAGKRAIYLSKSARSEYHMAVLAGFDKAMGIFDEIERKYKELSSAEDENA